MRYLIYLTLFLLSIFTSFAYESMHEKTPVGKIQIIDIPQRVALETSSQKSYFSEDNGLFRKLFKYINNNDLSMTTPVEAEINPGKMRFFVGKKDLEKDFKNSSQVIVRKLPPMKVVSIGIRGSYSEKRFNENLSKLSKWLTENKKYESLGDAYGVYWNGPFVPGPFKRSEVHLPIRLKKTQKQPKKLTTEK